MTRRSVLNASLVVMLLALVGLHWAVLPDPSRRNWRILPGMADSPAYETQAPLWRTGDGVALDPRPPPGSVARGFLPFAYPAAAADAERAGVELENPFSADDAAALRRGAQVFATFCAVCHGAGGKGDGVVTRRGVPPPPSLLGENARTMTDGRLYHIITRGQGNMSAYETQVERDDRWHAILHVRSLQGRQFVAVATEVPGASALPAEAGATAAVAPPAKEGF